MGVVFKTTLDDHGLEMRCLEAMGRLRYVDKYLKEIKDDLSTLFRFMAPILACNIISDPEDLFLRSWIYTTPKDAGDVHHWVRETFSVRKGPFTTNDFILEMNKKQTPYTHLDGHSQIAHFYLLLGSDGNHGLFMHGPHTIMDARPTLRALDYMLEVIADPPADRLEDLNWGEEWTRLPVGPVAATGGPREDWDVEGLQLLQETTQIRLNPIVSEFHRHIYYILNPMPPENACAPSDPRISPLSRKYAPDSRAH